MTAHDTGSAGLIRRVVSSIRSHPVVTAIVVVAASSVLGFSFLIELHPVFALALMATVGVGAWLLHRLWMGRRRSVDPTVPSPSGRVVLMSLAVSGVLTFGFIQLVPYGHAHSNPPVTGEPRWADDQTRELMMDACFACHSNEVDYPAYASIAPMSWAVQRHVDEGRDKVNYSELATDPGDADETIEVIEQGEMPPASFTRFGLHPEANLSATELRQLIEGLRATPGMSEADGNRGPDGD